MSILEIILFGYIVNFLSLVLMTITVLILTVIGSFSNPVGSLKASTAIMLSKQKLDNLRTELKKNRINPYVQKDFALIVPFAAVVTFLNSLYKIYRDGIYEFVYYELSETYDTLEQRLINSKKDEIK